MTAPLRSAESWLTPGRCTACRRNHEEGRCCNCDCHRTAARIPAAPSRNWRPRAACQDVDPELFFPSDRGGPAAEAQAAKAKAVCAGCPVREQCLDWALSHSLGHGVWGGLTEEERRASGGGAGRRAPALCVSGRHPKTSPGKCPECVREYERNRERPPRDYAAVYARRTALARERNGLAA